MEAAAAEAFHPAAAGGRPLVLLDGVNKRYANGTVALRSMSLQVNEGEFVSLLGPSGCGKSTALRMIAGLLSLSSGRISGLGGQGAAALGARQDISFVFQEPTLMPWATVAENVYLPLKLNGVARAEGEAAVREALALVGLSQFAGVYPRELSGGMKMRVSIARAMVTRPRLLLMDEPFAALDEMTRAKLNDDVLRLWQAQRLTVMFVTHSVWEAVYLSSRIVVMAARPGRVVDDIAIEAPYPRDPAFRTSAQYADYSRRVTQALRGTMDAAQEGGHVHH